MRALCWNGINDLTVETVPDPGLVLPHDAIVKVGLSSVCGSDLHLLGGYIPTMKKGDVIGHEFMGEVVDLGPEVKKLRRGDRVVVSSVIGCGGCTHCQEERWSLCDNTNPNAALVEKLWGDSPAGIFGYSHALGGYAGSHAQYIRVPFADQGAFRIPEAVKDETAVFISDAVPTGFMAADFCDIKPGDVVAVWGCGGVGQMAIWAAFQMGAHRVIAIDRFPNRLAMARDRLGAEVLDYTEVDVVMALHELTGGRGPDACIDAVGLEAHGTGLDYAYDRVKQSMRLETERPQVVRQAILSCRKGGIVSIVGVYGGFVDKFPLGAAMNKGLTLRMGQQHGQRYIPQLLQLAAQGELDPSYLLTHPMPLEQAPAGYAAFKQKTDGCVRAVFRP